MASTSTYFADTTRPALPSGLRAAAVIMLAWAAFCAWHYTGGQVWGFAKGVGKSVWQMEQAGRTTRSNSARRLQRLDPADPASREWLLNHINDIYRNSDEVRQGPWNPGGGGASDDLFFRKGDDVVVTKNDGEFVTILKGGKDNGWFRGAAPK